jgi:hypothetical protein
MIDELERTWKETAVAYEVLSWRDWRKTMWVRLAAVLAEIASDHFLSTALPLDQSVGYSAYKINTNRMAFLRVLEPRNGGHEEFCLPVHSAVSTDVPEDRVASIFRLCLLSFLPCLTLRPWRRGWRSSETSVDFQRDTGYRTCNHHKSGSHYTRSLY